MLKSALILAAGALTASAASVPTGYDVLVYGATPAGIAAAVSASREGARVVLLEESAHVGGMTAGGMSNTDFRTFEAVQGWYREYMDRVVAYYSAEYGPDSRQVKDCAYGAWAEPKVTQLIFQRMLAEAKVELLRRHRLTGVMCERSSDGRTRPYAAEFLDEKANALVRLTARVFVDATYEGDLLAASGARHLIGRESRARYGELLAGVIYFSTEGRILPGSTGEEDAHVQCYNFRVCMTNNPANRAAVGKPAGYRRDEYRPMLDFIRARKVASVNNTLVRFRYLPNQKADVNDLMSSPFSLRLLGENDAWPEGSPPTRAKIFERFKTYTLGFLWFLQNDPEVPAELRQEMAAWALPRDEFEETGNFPPVLYVREARRLLGDWVFTEKDTQPAPGSVRAPAHSDSIAVGDYTLDSHGVRQGDVLSPDVPEGRFAFPVVPYQIPYRVLLPANVDYLLVPVCVSASHVGFQSLRMEPQWAALGQAAGIAAAMAARHSVPPRSIPLAELQRKLHARRAITIYTSDVLPGSPYFEAVQYFGTRGLFQHLVPRKPYRSPASLNLGQWSKAWPYHDVEPQLAISPSLAKSWTALAGASCGSDPTAGGKLTRGEFLNRLYRCVNAQRSSQPPPGGGL
jgi:hypothetical protein